MTQNDKPTSSNKIAVRNIRTNNQNRPLKILSKQQALNNSHPCQLILVNGTNSVLTNHPLILVATPQISAPMDNQQNDFLLSNFNRYVEKIF